MQQNKTFYGLGLGKKSARISPLKQKNDKKTNRPPLGKSIVKLPSVKNTISLGPQLKNYQLGQLLGQGAFARVFMARRMTDGHKCVIKIIEKSKISSQERKKAFKRELQALNLPKHKNLVHLIDQFESQNQICIVMEYFSSKSIADYLKQNRPIDNPTLQKIVKQICEGLIHLHSHGMSHRDVKPDNILINDHDELKIIDFGFATTQELDEVVVAGTPQFMAPELITRKNYDPFKADVWAFGVMLYWMALGYYPQEADQKKKKTTTNIVNKKWQEFNLNFPVDFNPGLQYLIRKMLNPDPKQRIKIEDILEDTWIKPKHFKDEIQRLRQSKNIQGPITILS